MLAVSTSIEDSFSDIHELSKHCRFNDCSHSTEIGCAVLMAVKTKEINEERYRSFMKLIKESEFHEMSYLERRKKDKQFGRMIKTAKKQVRKK